MEGLVFIPMTMTSSFSSQVSLPHATAGDVLEGHWRKTPRRKALQRDD